MKILQLISSSGYYGAETMLINLAKCLGRLGFPCVVGVFHNWHKPNTDVEARARREGLLLETIPCKGRADWGAVRAIRNCIQTHRIDIVHTHGYKADLYGYAAARDLPTPLIATCHVWFERGIALRVYARLDRIVLRRFHAVVAVSEHIARILRRSGVPQSRITTIGNGIDLSCFRRAKPTLAKEIGRGAKTVVGVVARLIPEKGHAYLLRAAQELLGEFPDTAFVFVGAGPERKRLVELARELGIERSVILAGVRRDMPGVYASMDIFVLPSFNEGMPMTILEALASRKPVVATRVAAIPKLVLHEQTGLLVEPGDTVGLRKAIGRLLAAPQLRRELGEKGQAWVRQHFSADVMAKQYQLLYQQLVNARPAA